MYMNCLQSLSEWSVELTVIPRSAALGDLLRGHLVQSVHARVRIHGLTQRAVEKAPTGSQLPFFFFFFFFFYKIQVKL